MSKLVRLVIALALVLGVVFLAGGAAWAGPDPEIVQDIGAAQVVVAPLANGDDGGTVKPPPPWVWFCDEGIFSVGGQVTLSVENLAPDYCIRAFLRDHRWPPARIPPDIGNILADVTFIRVYYQGRFIRHLPVEDGQVELCYALPLNKQVKIYYMDAYGKGKPNWTPLQTTIKDGMACAPAQDSGAYALIGQ